ncbi:MAG: ATP-binding protein [bacterium]|nr:ATP-binding protein [bacterium]
MKTVKVPEFVTTSLVDILRPLYLAFKDIKDGEKVCFDLSSVSFASPLFVLPLVAYLKSVGGDVFGSSSKLQSYFDCIHFPAGVDSVSGFEALSQSNKTYVPISILKKSAGAGRDRLETLFSNMVLKVLGTSKASSAVYYPISELVTNIIEHSKVEEGYMFGQYYPKKNYLDICIVDRGRGLAGSYSDELGLAFSDTQAIEEVMKGHSTKVNTERGFGVRTSKRVVCEAMGGEFMLLSGSAVLIVSKGKQQLVNLPGFHWQGVIVAYRIPKPQGSIDITPYLE